MADAYDRNLRTQNTFDVILSSKDWDRNPESYTAVFEDRLAHGDCTPVLTRSYSRRRFQPFLLLEFLEFV